MKTDKRLKAFERIVGPVKPLPTPLVVDEGGIRSVHRGFAKREVFEMEIRRLPGETESSTKENSVTIHVEGMTRPAGWDARVKRALEGLDGVTSADMRLEEVRRPLRPVEGRHGAHAQGCPGIGVQACGEGGLTFQLLEGLYSGGWNA